MHDINFKSRLVNYFSRVLLPYSWFTERPRGVLTQSQWCISHIPPISAKFIISTLFSEMYTFPPILVKFTSFCLIYNFSFLILTTMRTGCPWNGLYCIAGLSFWRPASQNKLVGPSLASLHTNTPQIWNYRNIFLIVEIMTFTIVDYI